MPTNLDAARLPWRHDIIYHKRGEAIARNIVELLRLTVIQSANVNGVQLLIIAEGHWCDLWFTTLIYGCKSPKALRL